MSTHPSPTGPARRLRAIPRLLSRAPAWLSIALGLLLACGGALLVTRPLTALGVLGWYLGLTCVLSGAAELLSGSRQRGQEPEQERDKEPEQKLDQGPEQELENGPDREREQEALDAARADGVLRLAGAWAWILVGVAILVWVGRSVDLLGPLVAVILICSGVIAVARLIWERSSQRWLRALFGLSELSFGLLALLWPDATLIIVAILFGGRTAGFGLWLIWRGFSSRRDRGHDGAAATTPRRRRLTVLRWAGATTLLVLAVLTLIISHSFRDGVPVADDFYQTPSDMPDTPGQLIRFEPYDGNLPGGMTGYRLLYVTTDADGEAVPASAALAIPEGATTAAPLISWAHGTVGVARGCAPTIGPDAITEQGMPAMDSLTRNGWAMVATDYPGMGTEGDFPYLIGPGQGLAVLDAARAARQVPGVDLAESTAIWGHSQGGHAALWAGQLADTYAPDLQVVGTAALSPASDPHAMAETVLAHPDALGASLGVSFVVDAYTRYYDDLDFDFDQVVAPSARTIVREAAARCTGEGGTLVTALTGLAIARDQPIVRDGAIDGPFGDRLQQNIARGPWDAPLFIGQGEADEVIPFAINESYLAGLCAAGHQVEFQGYAGGTHMSVLETGSALSTHLEEWTQARLAGEPAADDCV